jgi:hypothetical protein
MIFGSTNFFQPWLPKFNVNYNTLKEAGNSICFLKTTWSIFQKAWWLCLVKQARVWLLALKRHWPVRA